jgi:hypothetical protein
LAKLQKPRNCVSLVHIPASVCSPCTIPEKNNNQKLIIQSPSNVASPVIPTPLVDNSMIVAKRDVNWWELEAKLRIAISYLYEKCLHSLYLNGSIHVQDETDHGIIPRILKMFQLERTHFGVVKHIVYKCIECLSEGVTYSENCDVYMNPN